ncbi:hypothetical protein FPQ18DRAFT_294896 [Pyronema domesticum]|uniref:Translation initiation factor eIF2B subunit delta n=1 Tax=Pyronema omphalodes (strain CBS 100304) TaxID=1076935 RepID=U4L2F8_PYROM|nr:hypothetical protein FPQ18DRAFT_294896 [Pyronema domesticum]CCX10029.1 Similar to Probable translation initiation factor eIF-2B subunit delta; acc. no. Q09924 [Pyronema omphalodes CBS 100304]
MSTPAPSPAPAAATPVEKKPAEKKPAEKKPAEDKTAATGPDGKQLTGKELKELKKAEKAARRQQSKGAEGAAPAKEGKGKPDQKKGQLQHKGGKKQGADGPVITLRLGAEAPTKKGGPAIPQKEVEAIVVKPQLSGLVALLRDIEVEQDEKKKRNSNDFGIEIAHSDVHPAILTLGMQINKRIIVGSSARCMGFLLAIKRVIEDYETPPDSTLNRHLPGQYFSHQINYIIAARPMCTAMGNTVRWLKTEISNLSPDLTDEIAKRDLVDKIEGFIHERLLAANDVIINTVCDRYIQDEDVIVTFSKSQVVEKALLEAKERGKNFRVVVVDSRPLEEGRNLLESLCEAGIECSYSSLYALDDLMADATKVFVGAHAMMANGSLYSRAGSSVVSMAASAAGIPVLVLCETIKFSDKINIDGIVNNELGTTDSLVNSINGVAGSLKSWEGVQNNTLACFMYDVTPSSCIAAVICEHGCVTPEGVSTVLRISGLER